MDQFAIHPYQDNSSQPPTAQHPKTKTISISDYPKLVTLLGQAFDGTAQPGSKLPIVYAEYGVETVVPPGKASAYTGTEPATIHPVDETKQGAYYREAIGIAFCQPTVRAILVFHAFDETDRNRWQSGVYYADRTPKAGLNVVRTAADESRRGVVARCDGLKLPVKATLTAPSARAQARAKRANVSLRCDIDCDYVARVERMPGQRWCSSRAAARPAAGGRRSGSRGPSLRGATASRFAPSPRSTAAAQHCA